MLKYTYIHPILGIWGSFWRAKFLKIGDSLPRTEVNHRAKFDAASFILATIQTNKQTDRQTNSKRYVHLLPIGMCGQYTAA